MNSANRRYHVFAFLLLMKVWLLLSISSLSAQPGSVPVVDVFGHMGLGTLQPHPSALLDLTSNSAGFLLPRLSSTQRDAITNPATGLMIFNTSLNQLELNTGTSFAPVWSAVLTSASTSVWFTNGNDIASAGTDPNQQFIGTIAGNSQPFVVATNGIERLRLASTGELGIGTVAPTPSRLLDVNGTPGTPNIRLRSLAGTATATPLEANDGIVVADPNGDLSKRTPDALGLAAANEPFITFAPDAGSLSNNRRAAAGTGISITVDPADNGAFTIDNTGVLSATGTANQVLVNATTGSAQSGAITLSTPQDIHSGASPTFAGLTLTGLTPSRIVRTNGSSALTTGAVNLAGGATEVTGLLPITNGGTNSGTALNNNRIMVSAAGAIVEASALANGQLLIGSSGVAPVAASISGTPNQVTVANGAGSITLSTPQDIHSGASPTFAGLTLTGLTPSRIVRTNGSSALTTGAVNLAGGATEVTGLLPIANGGTNSGTALNNNRIMVSTAGAIVEASALANGQLLIGSSGVAPVAASISGTPNQVTVANGAGSITLSTPQDIHSGASPTFVNANLTGLPSGSSFTNLVVSNGGLLETRTVASLGSFWALSGNSITSGDVLGTTNAEDLNIVTGGASNVRMNIDDATGLVNVRTSVDVDGTLNSDGSTTLNGSVSIGDGSGSDNITLRPGSGSVVLDYAPFTTAGSDRLLKAQASTGVVQAAVAGTDYESPLTFGNGLSRSGNGVVLGGTLTSATTLNKNGNSMTLSGSGDVVFSGGNVGIGGVPTTGRSLEVVGTSGTPNVRLGSVSGSNLAGPLVGLTDGVLIADANGDVRKVDPGEVGGNGWKLIGNSGTDASVNFLGTIDSIDFVVRTKNVERLRATAGGYVGIGSAPAATSRLTVDSAISTGTHYSILQRRVLATPGNNNLVAGIAAGASLTTATKNTFIGDSAGFATNNDQNTFIGSRAGRSTATGISNTFIGSDAGVANTASGNTFIGTNAGQVNTIGNANTYVGLNAGNRNNGNQNTFIGSFAGANVQTGISNVYVGTQAGLSNVAGTNNTAVGKLAGAFGIKGIHNSYFGSDAGAHDSGSFNTFLGSGAGANSHNASSNVFVGYNSGGQNTVGSDNIFIGADAGNGNTRGFSNVYIGRQAGSTADTAFRNTFVGYQSGLLNDNGSENAFFGNESGRNNSDGFANTFIGPYAGSGNTTGTFNTFVGMSAGASNGTSEQNTFIGATAGQFNTTGELNTFVGIEAGRLNQSGIGNTFVGAFAGDSNISAGANSFFGRDAGLGNTTGGSNTFLGAFAGQRNKTGLNNTFVGTDAGRQQDSADENTFIGVSAGFANKKGTRNAFLGGASGAGNTIGNDNTFLGYRAGNSNDIGDSNTFVGRSSGVGNTTGDYNTFVGLFAGENNTIGSGNAALGYKAGPSAAGLTNATAIGSLAHVSQNNSIVLGSINGTNGATANTSVGIGTTAPRAELDVTGTGAIIVPIGTTAQRPGTPVQGMIRFNTTTSKFEGYDGTTWIDFH